MEQKVSAEIIQQKTGIQNPVNIFLANKRPGTRETYSFSLNKVARKLGFVDAYSFNWGALRYEHTTLLAAWITKNNASTYAYKVMAAVRGVLKTCRTMGQMSADDYWNALEGCKVKINENPRPSAGRMLSPEEVQAFLKTCRVGPRNRGVRDAAIFMVMVGCGLRVGEPGKLKFEEFDKVSGKLLVHGKGGKTRTVYLVGDVRAAVDEWLKIRGAGSGPFFYTVVKSDQLSNAHVETHAIWAMLRGRQVIAKMAHFTPHDLRRTFISDMLATGTDIATISDMAGHRSPNVTMRYDRRGEARKIAAAALVHIPFEARGEI